MLIQFTIFSSSDEGCTYDEARFFIGEKFGFSNPRIFSCITGKEMKKGDLMQEQMYLCSKFKEKGLPSHTFMSPQVSPKGPKAGFFLGNITSLFGGADGVSDTLAKLAEQCGSPMKIVGPGGVALAFIVSDPGQIAQICDDEETFKKLRPKPQSGLGLIRGGREVSGLFTSGSEEEQWGVGHRICLPAFSLKSMKVIVVNVSYLLHFCFDCSIL